MKYFIIAILALFTVIGCGEKNKETIVKDQKDKYAVDTSDIKTTPLQEPNQKYDLNYTLEKNKTYNYRISTTSSDDLKITTADTTLNQTINQSAVYLAGLKLNRYR